jgi:hypothetical protein
MSEPTLVRTTAQVLSCFAVMPVQEPRGRTTER